MTGSNNRPSAVKTVFAIEWWPVGKVKPYPKNPRKVTDAAVAKVGASITEFGWRQPIVVDGKGVILAGHARRLRAGSSAGPDITSIRTCEPGRAPRR